MRVFKETIQNANNLEDLLPLLEGLAAELRTYIKGSRLTAEQLQAMSSYLASIRLLLNVLERKDIGSNDTSRWLAEQYVQLEGKVKEMRNDLDRSMRASRS